MWVVERKNDPQRYPVHNDVSVCAFEKKKQPKEKEVENLLELCCNFSFFRYPQGVAAKLFLAVGILWIRCRAAKVKTVARFACFCGPPMERGGKKGKNLMRKWAHPDVLIQTFFGDYLILHLASFNELKWVLCKLEKRTLHSPFLWITNSPFAPVFQTLHRRFSVTPNLAGHWTV